MGGGLADLWGLGDPEESAAATPAQQEARSAFDDAIRGVNESLQSAKANAAPDEHAALDSDRKKLYEAYQLASSQFGEHESAGQSAMERVIAAAGTLGGKATQSAEAASAARDQWNAQEERFDDMMLQVNELTDVGHPKSETLQKLCGAIRDKAAGRSYGDCGAAVEELGPKLEEMMAEHRATIAEAETAAANEAEGASWLDKATGAVKDLVSNDEDQPPSGPAKKAEDTTAEGGNWWDKITDAAGDGATGNDDTEGSDDDWKSDWQDGETSEDEDQVASSLKPNSSTVSVDIVCNGDDEVTVSIVPSDGGGTAPQPITQIGTGEGQALPTVAFADLADGAYAVTVAQGGRIKTQTARLPEGPSSLSFDLTTDKPEVEIGEAGVSISLIWASNNKPVAAAAVRLHSLHSGTQVSGTTDSVGMAHISGMAPELWTVQSIAKEGRTYAATGVADLTGGGVEPMNLVILPQVKGEDEREPLLQLLMDLRVRAIRLRQQVDQLVAAAKPGERPNGRFPEGSKQRLLDDGVAEVIGTISDAQSNWKTYDDRVKESKVSDVEKRVVALEADIKNCLSELEEEPANRWENLKTQLVGIENDVRLAEQGLNGLIDRVISIRNGIKNKQIETAVDAALDFVTTALSLFPPTAILGTAISAARLATETDLIASIGQAREFSSKASPTSSAVLSACSTINNVVAARKDILARCNQLKQALVDVDRQTNAMIGHLQNFQTVAAQATKASGEVAKRDY